jgi:starvation-inducible DNA-binding protein
MNIGLIPSNQKTVAETLNRLLADASLLYTKTRKFHWNVTGPNFSELHSLFQGQYEALAEAADELAERVRQLGQEPLGTLQEFKDKASLKEYPGKQQDSASMLEELLSDHESVIRALRVAIETCEKAKDAGTANFLTDLMQSHEKIAWILRSYIPKK